MSPSLWYKNEKFYKHRQKYKRRGNPWGFDWHEIDREKSQLLCFYIYKKYFLCNFNNRATIYIPLFIINNRNYVPWVKIAVTLIILHCWRPAGADLDKKICVKRWFIESCMHLVRLSTPNKKEKNYRTRKWSKNREFHH